MNKNLSNALQMLDKNGQNKYHFPIQAMPIPGISAFYPPYFAFLMRYAIPFQNQRNACYDECIKALIAKPTTQFVGYNRHKSLFYVDCDRHHFVISRSFPIFASLNSNVYGKII